MHKKRLNPFFYFHVCMTEGSINEVYIGYDRPRIKKLISSLSFWVFGLFISFEILMIIIDFIGSGFQSVDLWLLFFVFLMFLPFFLIYGVYVLILNIRLKVRGPILTINKWGLKDSRIHNKFINWVLIDDLYVNHLGKHEFICIKLHKETIRNELHPNALKRIWNRFALNIGFQDYNIYVDPLEVEVHTLVDAIRILSDGQYFKAHQGLEA
ncbi:MAG: hypothetical protein MRY83_22070 [Flavobacteriales bacterium]|nr:hypothetical protein [Flavobacteriales bacterium]